MRSIPALLLVVCLLVPAASWAQEGVVDLSAPAPGRVALQLRSRGAALQVVVERRIERPAAQAVRRGVVLGAARCETPCMVWVPPGRLRLRANGSGVRGTDEDIDVPEEGATALVRAGRAAVHNLGIGLLAAGATTLLATMFVALADQGVFNGTTRGSLGLDPGAVAGAAGGGAALLAAGIPLMLLHRNGVSVTPSLRAAVALGAEGGGVALTGVF